MAVYAKKSGAPTGEIRISGGGAAIIFDDSTHTTFTTTDPNEIALLDQVSYIERVGSGSTYRPPVLKSPLEVVQGSYPTGSVLTLTTDGWEGKPASGGGGTPTSPTDPGYSTIYTEFGKVGGMKFKLAIPVSTSLDYRHAYNEDWAANGLPVWKSYVDHALDVEAMNGIKMAGDGVTTQINTALPNFLAIGDYAASRGANIFIELVALQNGGGQPAMLASAAAICAAIKDRGWRIIGIDVNNEINYVLADGESGSLPRAQPTAPVKAYLTDLFGIVADNLPNIPVSASIHGDTIDKVSGTSAADWIPTMASLIDSVNAAKNSNLKFYVNWHPYAVWTGEARDPYTAADYWTIADLWKQYPIFLGEAGSGADLTGVKWENVYAYMADAWAGRRNMVGGAMWRQDAYNPNTDSDPRRPQLLAAVRTMQRIDGGNFATTTVQLPNATMTGSLAALTSSGFVLDASKYAMGDKVPVWRVVADTDAVDSGDAITVEVRGGAGVALGTGNRLAAASAVAATVGGGGFATTPDIGPDNHVAALVGSPAPTLSPFKFGAGMHFGNGGHINIPQMDYGQEPWLDCWISPDTDATGNYHLMGQWKANAAANGDAILQFFYDGALQRVGGYFLKDGGTWSGAASPNGSVPHDGGVYHVGFGRRNGYSIICAEVNGFMFSDGVSNGYGPFDGVTPSSIGDTSNGAPGVNDGPFKGKIAWARANWGGGPSTDFNVDTVAPDGTEAGLNFLFPLATINGVSGANVALAHLETPWLPFPATPDYAQVFAKNVGGDGTIKPRLEIAWR